LVAHVLVFSEFLAPLNDSLEQPILDQLKGAVKCLYVICGLKAVLPLDNLVLVHAHEKDLPLPSIGSLVNYFIEHHPPAVIPIVLDEYAHVQKVALS